MDETMDLIQKAHEGDKAARDKLVVENMGLIWSIVRRFDRRGYEMEDLFQIQEQERFFLYLTDSQPADGIHRNASRQDFRKVTEIPSHSFNRFSRKLTQSKQNVQSLWLLRVPAQFQEFQISAKKQRLGSIRCKWTKRLEFIPGFGDQFVLTDFQVDCMQRCRCGGRQSRGQLFQLQSDQLLISINSLSGR